MNRRVASWAVVAVALWGVGVVLLVLLIARWQYPYWRLP